MIPPVIYAECDYGADWPTWVPNPDEPLESGRTSGFEMDDVPISDELRRGLLGWQHRFMDLTWPPDEPGHRTDPAEWLLFVNEGRRLAISLQAELGDAVDVRFRLDDRPPDQD